jgi:3-phosphoshikimate 1-carboxyvinyltransferase
MALPDLIEIVPLDQPVRAEITVPGSKSITNRALILAALADGETVLRGALWSEDTQIMVECLQDLGFMVNVEPDPAEPCNRTITVYGNGGAVPPGGTESQPLDLFVGNAGTAARFLAAFVCLGKGVYRLSGVPRMHERPQAALFQALRELGYRVETENGNDKLPVRIFGSRSRGDETQTKKTGIDQSLLTSSPAKKCRVSIEESSQFASALLLSAGVGGWRVEIEGENAEESPYVAMTSKLVEAFPKKGGTFQIEPDASSGSYFWGASWFLAKMEERDYFAAQMARYEEAKQKKPFDEFVVKPLAHQSFVYVFDWPTSGWQLDADFSYFFPVTEFCPLPKRISREGQLADSIMTAIVLAAAAGNFLGVPSQVSFECLGRLRVQECERVVALRTELTKCGAKVVEEGDTLTVWPSPLHGAEIETYHDHRMAMCFAILGLKVPGIKIKNPACVKKTFPNFFQKLAAPPPHGLGAEIWEIKNGQRTRKLSGKDLFAD